MQENNLTQQGYMQTIARQSQNNNVLVTDIVGSLLNNSEGVENIDKLLSNLNNSMLNLIDTTENPKTISQEQIIATMLFKNMIFDNPDFISRLMYVVLMRLTRDFADQTKQFFMPAEALTLNYAWICFLHTNLSTNDTTKVFNPSIDLTFELPYFISKNDQEKIKELITKFSSFREDEIKFLSFSPYNSFDFNDFAFGNTPGLDNGDTFLLSLISLLYYHTLMINKEKEKRESKDREKEELKIAIETDEDRIDKYMNYLNDFTESLPSAADILNAYREKDKNE